MSNNSLDMYKGEDINAFQLQPVFSQFMNCKNVQEVMTQVCYIVLFTTLYINHIRYATMSYLLQMK